MSKEELLTNIKVAMQQHELKVYYQPQYDAITSKLVGAEALVRWIKPDGSVIMPGSFIPRWKKIMQFWSLTGIC